MSKELVIASNRHEIKVALLEDDQLTEVYFQRANEYSLAGSIHKGRVTRVLPGMQSAFVDLGLERDTFLYVSDFLEEHDDIDKVEERPVRAEREGREPREGGRDRNRGRDRDRGDRDRERPAAASASAAPTPAEAATMVAPPVIEAPAADEGVTVVAAPDGAVQPASDRPRNDRGDRGGNRADDRNRGGRGGRRRGRGGRSGFPDSKYAGGREESRSERPAPAEEPAERVAQPESAAAEPAAEIMLLPGESLAKYRNRPAPVLEEVEPEIEDDVEAEEAIEPADVIEPVYDAAEIFPPENAEPDAPVHHKGAEPLIVPPACEPIVPEVVAAEPDHAAHAAAPVEEPKIIYGRTGGKAGVEPPELPAHPVTVAPVLDTPPELAGVAPLDEDEDHEIQSMILAGVEDEDEDDEEDEEMDEADRVQAEAEEALQAEAEGRSVEGLEGEGLEAEGANGEAAEGDATEAQAGSEGAPLTAAVREQGGRYPHRTSRRMRRRGRGGERGSERGERTERPAGEAAPEVKIEGRTDVRSESKSESRSESRSDSRPESRSESRPERQASRPDRGPLPLITDLLKEGQEIIVQIAKEPLGQKGARITSHIALPGRYVVYMPTLEHMGVSRKIGSDEERQRLKRILTGRKPAGSGGFITRTAAEGRTEDEIAADMEFLHTLWTGIKSKAEKKPAPLLLHHDLDIVQRILRDQLTDNFKAIWVDNEEMYESIIGFVQRFQPSLTTRIKLYTRDAPIFDAFNITQELEKALRPKVWLKSGGYIVINQTEALVAIDVNTGKYVGKSNRLEDTIVKTNTEAIKEIVRQIRLRDLGGIIVIDFIDMDERKNRQKVMQALEEAMRVDRAPYKILQFNDFGLVAITRKRVKQSLERTLCSPCPHCEGAGYVKSVQTIVGEILTEARKMASSVEGKDVMLRIHPDVAKIMKSHSNKYLEELEEVLRRPVLVKSDPTLHHEKFDLA